jgi:MiaB/RimO family radical SAM methylthiotransferase
VKESLEIIEKLKKYKKEIIIAGCLPEIAKNQLEKFFKGKTISTKDLEKIDEFFKDFQYKFSTVSDSNFPHFLPCELLLIFKTKPLTKIFSLNSFHLIKEFLANMVQSRFSYNRSKTYFLRINQGCLGNCAYCSIKKAIGPLKSKPPENCLEEYKQILNLGCENVVILGDDVGAYGLDLNTSFPELLNRLSKIEQGFFVKWSIKEMHPQWIVKYYLDLLPFIQRGKIIHILCGVQSGSSRILKLMNRYSNIGMVQKVLKEFKKVNPNLKLSAQIIIGFPSETEEDFLKTIEFIREIKFNEVFIYPYSNQEGTIAFKLPNQIPDEIKRRRIKQIVSFLKKEKINYYCENN